MMFQMNTRMVLLYNSDYKDDIQDPVQKEPHVEDPPVVVKNDTKTEQKTPEKDSKIKNQENNSKTTPEKDLKNQENNSKTKPEESNPKPSQETQKFKHDTIKKIILITTPILRPHTFPPSDKFKKHHNVNISITSPRPTFSKILRVADRDFQSHNLNALHCGVYPHPGILINTTNCLCQVLSRKNFQTGYFSSSIHEPADFDFNVINNFVSYINLDVPK